MSRLRVSRGWCALTGCYIVATDDSNGSHSLSCELLTSFAGFPICFVQTITDSLCLWWFLKLSLLPIAVSSSSCSPAEVVFPRGRSVEFPVEAARFFARGIHFKHPCPSLSISSVEWSSLLKL